MGWNLTASGFAAHDDPAVAATLERELLAGLSNLLANPSYGVSASDFHGEHAAGTPGLPEPEPEPAPVPLSLEEQNAALAEQIAELKAQLAQTGGQE